MLMNAWVRDLPTDKVAAWLEKNGERVMQRYHTSDPYFALWMFYVDKSVMAKVMLSLNDLEDWDYISAYEEDSTPREAATSMLEDLGYWGWYE